MRKENLLYSLCLLLLSIGVNARNKDYAQIINGKEEIVDRQLDRVDLHENGNHKGKIYNDKQKKQNSSAEIVQKNGKKKLVYDRKLAKKYVDEINHCKAMIKKYEIKIEDCKKKIKELVEL